MSNRDKKIAIIDYGVGNLYSLVRAFRFFKVEPRLAEEPAALDGIDAMVLPGVGSFAAGMRGLKIRGLAEKVKAIAGENKPVLGICLGAQLLLSRGYEFGDHAGLDIIKGEAVHFPALAEHEKIPQVGWNTIKTLNADSQDNILKIVKENDHFYFVHSYVLEPEAKENILAQTEYGGHTFCSAVKSGNIYGCQFHPEKSGQAGLKIIENFINLISYGKN